MFRLLISRSSRSVARSRVIPTNLVHKQFLPSLHRSLTTETSTEIDSTIKAIDVSNDEELPFISWPTFLKLLEQSPDDVSYRFFGDQTFNIHKSSSLTSAEKIERLQRLLRELHSRINTNSDFRRHFLFTCHILMNTYVDSGDLKSAKLVFEGLVGAGIEPNHITMNTIINGIQRHSTRNDLYKFMQSLEKRDMVKHERVYESIIYALKHFNDLRGCQYYFAKMTKEGLNDVKCYQGMMEAYRHAKKYDQIWVLYQDMKTKKMEINKSIYNIVLASVRTSDKALEVCEEMKSAGTQLTASFYLTMHMDPLQAIEDMKKTGTPPTIRDYNEFLMYYMRKNKFKEAADVWHAIKQSGVALDQYSYGIIMDMLNKDTETPNSAVFDLYEEMKHAQVKPDTVVYTTLLTACSQAQDLEKALQLLDEMSKFGAKPNVYTFNSILSILSNMQGASYQDLDRASLIWSKMTSMNIQPDTRTYNNYLSIISKLVTPAQVSNQDPASSLWPEKEEEEHVPKTVLEMLKMYRYMRRNHYESSQPDFITYSIVIHALAKAGQLRSAMQVYSDAKMDRVELPVSAYSQLMKALQEGNKMSEVMNIWYDLKIQGVAPDSLTYEIALETCEQLGLLESMTSIRNQRKADMKRLLELEAKKEERMKK